MTQSGIRNKSNPRSRFVPVPFSDAAGQAATGHQLLPEIPNAVAAWIPVLSGSVEFSMKAFFRSALEHQIMHPEYASTVILRADILIDEEYEAGTSSPDAYTVQGYTTTRRVRRKIVPKQTRDCSMEQECILASKGEGSSAEGLVLLLPDFRLLDKEANGQLPYYHPQVSALAFRYLAGKEPSDPATIRLDVAPLAARPLPRPVPPNHRVYRTALALLSSLYSVAMGFEEGYEKRIHHDLLTGREEVQDLYRELKERYR